MSEANVNVILDKICIASKIEYSSASEKLIDLTKEGELAFTILCSMASSVCGKVQDVVALIPIGHLDADVRCFLAAWAVNKSVYWC